MSEKTEKATAYKLKKAKEKGQVSKSNELTVYCTLLIGLSLLALLIPKDINTFQNLLRHLFNQAAQVTLTPDHITQLNNLIWLPLTFLWLPLAFTVLLTIILTTIAQTGLTWSPALITPNFNRLHIAKGFKKLFSMNSLFEAGKSLMKLICSIIVLLCIFKAQLTHLIQSALSNSINQESSLLMSFVLKTATQIVLVLLLLAFLDKKFTRWKFNKDQRMSKHEVKEEHRQKEGDPKIKSKIKQLQYQLRQKTAALKQVKTADVVITNPTHLAIALKYERGAMPAPKVVCKAQDKMVIQVKELARKHNVPIIEHKTLARMLHYSTHLNQFISKELFPLTADVFRELYRQDAAHE